ncbi:MAG: hypothetical protein JWN70_3930 [Planctomycetaceae bacterium]|nr:hypothetical protein [Planctomycetaceae bacterium]
MYIQPPNQSSGQNVIDPRMAVRTMQIICGALMMGVISFAVVAVIVRSGKAANGQAEASVIVAYIAAGFAALCIAVRVVVPPQTVKAGISQLVKVRRPDELTRLDLYQIYQSQMIVACAVLEGAGFFNLIAFIIAGQIWTLAIVVALVALMASVFPTLERVDNWADEQLRQLQLDPPRPI